jgi:four helix bundle protein
MPNDKNKIKYDLEERTIAFSEAIIEFSNKLPKDHRYIDIIKQLINATTSIGANYCEADDAESKKDFFHKIGICKKESRETKYWLRIIVKLCPELRDQIRLLWQEANELNLIFGAITKKK